MYICLSTLPPSQNIKCSCQIKSTESLQLPNKCGMTHHQGIFFLFFFFGAESIFRQPIRINRKRLPRLLEAWKIEGTAPAKNPGKVVSRKH
ncbi:hypothetical protein VTN49DRAFT_6812 [Thermomyces lanuginosus]|uniref:uncharacterized protein n=1 Tax=Thermomyces lanuginosus TaxID=5541 RepID=UPI0037445613